MTTLLVLATGTPVPQGSARAFVRGGRAVVTSDNRRLRPWRDTVTGAALEAIALTGWLPLRGAVRVELEFILPRPVSHWTKAGTRRPSAPLHPVGRPDLDKLIRSALDSLTDARAFLDDAQVVSLDPRKRYVAEPGEPPGLVARVMEETP